METSISSELVIPHTCKHPSGCSRNAKGYLKGMCYVHTGSRKCIHESDCGKAIVSKGLCFEHGGVAKCTHDSGCQNRTVSKGLCIVHGEGVREIKKCKHTSDCEKQARGGKCVLRMEHYVMQFRHLRHQLLRIIANILVGVLGVRRVTQRACVMLCTWWF